MTQAFNLSQLANKVNTSGQLDASTGLVNATPVANGGTGSITLPSKQVLIGNGTSAPTGVAPGTSGNLLTSNGTDWISAAPPATGLGIGQTWQAFTIGVDRIDGTVYTNSTGKPIMVNAHCTTTTGGSGGIAGYVDGLMIAVDAPYAIGAGYGGFISMVVPNGSTYEVVFAGSNGNLSLWAELR